MSDIDDKLNIMQNDAKLLGSLATAEMLPQIQETYRTALSSTLQTISASIQKLSLSVAPMVKVAEQLAEPMRKYAEVTKAATEAMQVSCAPVLKTLEAFQQNYLHNAEKLTASCARAMSTYADLSLSARKIADEIRIPQGVSCRHQAQRRSDQVLDREDLCGNPEGKRRMETGHLHTRLCPEGNRHAGHRDHSADL